MKKYFGYCSELIKNTKLIKNKTNGCFHIVHTQYENCFFSYRLDYIALDNCRAVFYAARLAETISL